MRIVIDEHDLPDAEHVFDGVPLRNVYVAMQIVSEPVGFVRGVADRARWKVEVRAVSADGGMDLHGRAVRGKRGERFLFLMWGDVGADNSFTMFRRAELTVGDIHPNLLAAAARDDGAVADKNE